MVSYLCKFKCWSFRCQFSVALLRLSALLVVPLLAVYTPIVHAQVVATPAAPAAVEQKLSASLRLGLAYTDLQNNSGDYSLQDFESRLRWQGKTQINAALAASGYIELALDSNDNTEDLSGIDQTRQIWAGLSGNWGSIKAGAQYGTFYDMVSVHTDLAWVGSCWTQLECERETRVVKLQTPQAPIILGVSVSAQPDDSGNDPADQIEYGFAYRSDNLLFSMAAASYADEAAFDGGMIAGAVLQARFSQLLLTVGYQQADRSVAVATGNAPQATTDVTNLTFALNYGNSFFIYNQGDQGASEPTWFTLGGTWKLAPSASLFYEYQVVDTDDGEDEETFFRGGFIYDW